VFTINRNPSVDDLRKFAWAMLIGFNGLAVLLLAISWWRAGGERPFFSPGAGLLCVCVVLCVVGTLTAMISLASPTLAKPLYVGWMTATMPIGVAMTTVMLSILFAVLLPIFSLIVRLGDPLHRRRTAGSSYWEPYKRHEPTLDRMRRPF
jgi:hypothetical protein